MIPLLICLLAVSHSSAEETAPPEKKQLDVLNWARDNGASIGPISVRYSGPIAGNDMVATRDIDIGETVLEIPRHLVIPCESFINCLIRLDEVVKDEGSIFSLWVASLPQSFDSGLFWPDADVLRHLDKKNDDVGDALSRTMAGISEVRDLAQDRGWTVNYAKWMMGVVLTRCFAAHPSVGFCSLIPIADITNHHRGGHGVSSLAFVDEFRFELQGSRPAKAGDILYVSYHPMATEHGDETAGSMLVMYGFVDRSVDSLPLMMDSCGDENSDDGGMVMFLNGTVPDYVQECLLLKGNTLSRQARRVVGIAEGWKKETTLPVLVAYYDFLIEVFGRVV